MKQPDGIADGVSEMADGADGSRSHDEEQLFTLCTRRFDNFNKQEKNVATLMIEWITYENLSPRGKPCTLITANDRKLTDLPSYVAFKRSVDRLGKTKRDFRLDFQGCKTGGKYDQYAIQYCERHFVSVFIHQMSYKKHPMSKEALETAFLYSLENGVEVWICIVNDKDGGRATPRDINDNLTYKHIYGPEKTESLDDPEYLHLWERKRDA